MDKIIPISKPTITSKEIKYVNNAIKSGWVSSLGEFINKFETKFADYCGAKYALTTANGTVALHLALVSLGIKKGDEVIVPDLTFIATANAIKYTGATVVTVDICKENLCIDPKMIEKAITARTKAIIPVHLYGHPANMNEIMEIATRYNLKVIEDAAEAHGAKINNKSVGSWGDCGVFSFYGNKIITTGEGGIITTDKIELYNRMVFLRDHAMSKQKKFWHTETGYNYRMTNLQAALGLAQLERIDKIIKKKIKIFTWYKDELGKYDNFLIYKNSPEFFSVFWMVAIQILSITEKERDNLLYQLKIVGIDSRPFFYPISDMIKVKTTATPTAHEVYSKGFNLPSYYDITHQQVKYICNKLIQIYEKQ